MKPAERVYVGVVPLRFTGKCKMQNQPTNSKQEEKKEEKRNRNKHCHYHNTAGNYMNMQL